MKTRNFIFILAGTLSLTCGQSSWADDTIYTWQDQQNDLTNYAAIPPDDQISSGNLKVFNPEKGLTTHAALPARDPLINPVTGTPVVPANATGAAAPAGTPPGAVVSQTPGSTPAPPAPAKPETASASSQPDPAKPANNAKVLTQGGSQQTIYPVDDPEQKRKISEQNEKLEASAKSAKRVAEEKRMDEMKDLAERVRNGAATKKEIAALMMYRQTANFRDARKAMAAPVKTVQSFE